VGPRTQIICVDWFWVTSPIQKPACPQSASNMRESNLNDPIQTSAYALITRCLTIHLISNLSQSAVPNIPVFLIQSLKTFSPKYSIALVYQAFTNLQLKTCCKRRWQTLSEILGPKPKLWNIFAKAIALADKASNNTHLDKLDSSLLTAAD
jgi:hypothetical protein